MIHARKFRNFRQVWWGGGGGGGGGSRSIQHIKKTPLTTFFFILISFSPQLNLQKSSGLFQRKLFFGGTFSQGGCPTFYRGGSNCFFPIETHITRDFPGARTPAPIWICPCDSAHRGLIYLLVFFLYFFNITFAKSFVERGGNVESAAVLPVVVVIKY